MSPTILVIEDDQGLARMLRAVLTQEGYNSEVAHDGPEGLEKAEALVPDLVLLDVMLPKMDGLDVCRNLRQIEATSKIPIILLTAKGSIADKSAGFAAGADDYLTKPFENAELKMRVAAQLRRVEMLTSDKATDLGRVVAVFSLRGGAGCSSLAVNLGVGLSRLWNTKVGLIDMALPTGLCDVMLNLRPHTNLGDLAVWGADQVDGDLIDTALAEHMTGVQLIGGVVSPLQAELLTDNLVRNIIGYLRTRYPYVVIDTSHDFSSPILAALDSADVIVMVLTPDISSIRVARSALEVFAELGYDENRVEIVVNHVFPVDGLSVAQIERSIRHPVSLMMPYGHGVWSEAINLGRPAILDEPQVPHVELLEDLSWMVSKPSDQRQTPTEPTPIWTRVVRRLRDKTSTT